MKQDENTWDSASAVDASSNAAEADGGRKDAGAAKSSTERGAAADKALIDAGGAIVSRLRLRPIAARALALLMEREDQTHGKQRAAIERALIEGAGGVEVLEQLAAAEAAAAQAAAEAAAMAQAEAEAAAAEAAQRPRLSPIETDLVALLEKNGPIYGTAGVGYALWPDREMQPQGAAIAASRILRRLLDRAYIASTLVGDRRTCSVTASGIEAREQDRIDAIDPRQLTLLEH